MKPPLLNHRKKKALVFCQPIFYLTTSTYIFNFQRERQNHVNGNNSNPEISGSLETAAEQSRANMGYYDYISRLQACTNNKHLLEGKLVHADIIHGGLECQDIFLANTLMNMYVKCEQMEYGRKVFDEMPERNVVSWTAMITAYARHVRAEEALEMFRRMQLAGVHVNQFTLSSILPACGHLGAQEYGKEIHGEIIRGGFQSNDFVGTALADMYGKCGFMEDARKVFDEMPERRLVLWNAMIAGYVRNGIVDKAEELFQAMPEQSIKSCTAMIAGYAQKGWFDEALKLFWGMPEQDTISWTAMVVGYAQNGHLDEALEFFRKMPEHNIVSWTAMIAGYVQNGYFEEGLKLFQEMRVNGMKPTSDTFNSILPACASMVALEHGKEIHEDIMRSGFLFDVFVGNALVDMYAKCGSIGDAYKVFEKMPARNVVSWTAMLVGYAIHGYGKEALQMFEQMLLSAIHPNHVTFLAVLYACCHAGLVDHGWRYFNCMTEYYHITPSMKHYCCMVDLLGRAGRLDEARDFINKIPIKPGVDVWISLLGACRIHNNIEVGEQAAERIFELNPTIPAPYVLLSNMYTAVGRWKDIEKIRKLMKDRRVKNRPGCSWIEANKQLHAFHVGD